MMDKDVLDRLFYGELCPWEKMPTGEDSLNQLMGQQSNAMAALQSQLDEQGQKLLSRYIDIRSQVEVKLHCHYFKEGFLLGSAFTQWIADATAEISP